MKELHRKDLASHSGSESCEADRKVRSEALTGEDAGEVWSREIDSPVLPTLLSEAEGNNLQLEMARVAGERRGRRPSACVEASSTVGLIAEINPVVRGWGNYYCKAHVRKLFAKLDRWIIQRIWSHRTKRRRNTGWKRLPEKRLYGELGLVKLIHLIPSLQPSTSSPL